MDYELASAPQKELPASGLLLVPIFYHTIGSPPKALVDRMKYLFLEAGQIHLQKKRNLKLVLGAASQRKGEELGERKAKPVSGK